MAFTRRAIKLRKPRRDFQAGVYKIGRIGTQRFDQSQEAGAWGFWQWQASNTIQVAASKLCSASLHDQSRVFKLFVEPRLQCSEKGAGLYLCNVTAPYCRQVLRISPSGISSILGAGAQLLPCSRRSCMSLLLCDLSALPWIDYLVGEGLNISPSASKSQN